MNLVSIATALISAALAAIAAWFWWKSTTIDAKPGPTIVVADIIGVQDPAFEKALKRQSELNATAAKFAAAAAVAQAISTTSAAMVHS